MKKHSKNYGYAILNEDGYFDFYDKDGVKINLSLTLIRITQKPYDNQFVISGPINIAKNKDEMEQFLKTK